MAGVLDASTKARVTGGTARAVLTSSGSSQQQPPLFVYKAPLYAADGFRHAEWIRYTVATERSTVSRKYLQALLPRHALRLFAASALSVSEPLFPIRRRQHVATRTLSRLLHSHRTNHNVPRTFSITSLAAQVGGRYARRAFPPHVVLSRRCTCPAAFSRCLPSPSNQEFLVLLLFLFLSNRQIPSL